jgi:hypothetical protein
MTANKPVPAGMRCFPLAQRDAFLERIKSLGDSPFGPVAGSVESRLEAADSILMILAEPLEGFVGQCVARGAEALPELEAGARLLSGLHRAVQQLRDVRPMTSHQGYCLSKQLRGFWVEFAESTELTRTASLRASASKAKPFEVQQGNRPTLEKTEWLRKKAGQHPDLTSKELADLIWNEAPKFDDGAAHFFWAGSREKGNLKMIERDTGKPRTVTRLKYLIINAKRGRK